MSELSQFGIPPSQRMEPSFTVEDEEAGVNQDLKPIIVAPPGYASPDPATNGVPLVAIEEYPLSVDLSEDYARDQIADTGSHGFETTMTPEEGLQELSGARLEGAPEDRKEWVKANWQDQARAYGLKVGGNAKEVQERVEAYEGELAQDQNMTAAEWIEEAERADNADELAEVRERYAQSGADYKTVDEAFDKAEAAFTDNGE
jgi:hypothetical protein